MSILTVAMLTDNIPERTVIMLKDYNILVRTVELLKDYNIPVRTIIQAL